MATETTPGRLAPVVCRYVRSKGAGVTYGDPVRWDNGYFPSAVFWCLHTADAVGPDDSFVHPHVCIDGRGCFCGPISDRTDGD